MQAGPQRRIVLYALIGLFVAFICNSAITKINDSAPPKIRLKYAVVGNAKNIFIGRPIDILVRKCVPSSWRKTVLPFLWRTFGIGVAFPLDIVWSPPSAGALRLITTSSGSEDYAHARFAKLYTSEGTAIEAAAQSTSTVITPTTRSWQQYVFQAPPTNNILVAKIFEDTSTGAVQVATFRFKNPSHAAP